MFDYSITSNKHPYTLEKTNEIVPDYLYIEEELYVAIIVNNMTQGIVYNWGMWAHKEVSEALMRSIVKWIHLGTSVDLVYTAVHCSRPAPRMASE